MDNHKRPSLFKSLLQLQNINRFSVSDHMMSSGRTSLIPGHCRNFRGDKANNGGPSSLGYHQEHHQDEHSNPSCSNKNQINNITNYNPPDYQSEAPVHMNNVQEEEEEEEELGTSTSAYSLEDTYFSMERIDQDSSPSTTENEEDEQVIKKFKRRRIHSETHNLSEKKRRYKINKKMRTLQALVPNSDKVDKATVLDNAIDYLKSLQFQYLQLMTTMGSRTNCMMLPMGMGLGMRMPYGVGFCPTVQFPTAPMLGLNAARMHLPMSTPPFFPMTTSVRPQPLIPIPPNSGSSGSILDFISMNSNSQFQESIQVMRESTNQ